MRALEEQFTACYVLEGKVDSMEHAFPQIRGLVGDSMVYLRSGSADTGIAPFGNVFSTLEPSPLVPIPASQDDSEPEGSGRR